MSGVHRALSLGLLAWSATLAPLATAVELRPDVGVIGGTLAQWDAFDEAGNAFGISTGLYIEDVRLTLSLAGVLPDSRAQGQFATLWLEGQWHPFQARLLARDLPLSPFALLGLGIALGDGASDADFQDVEPVRWSRGGPKPLIMAGLGLRYGEREGFYAALDLRTYNVSHAGATLAAGYTF